MAFFRAFCPFFHGNIESPKSRGKWRKLSLALVPKDLGPEYNEKDPLLGVEPGKPRTSSPKEKFFPVMYRVRQGFAERHLGHLFKVSIIPGSRIIISWVNLKKIGVWVVEHMAFSKSGG